MPATIRPLRRSLTTLEYLLKYPRRFTLGQTLLLLEKALGVADPLAGGDYDRACLRLHNRRKLTPVTTEVEKIEQQEDGSFDVTTGILNVIGSLGVLPHTLSRTLVKGCRRDPAIGEECDRITHRFISLWFRVWNAASPNSSEAARDLCHWSGIPREAISTLAAFAGLFARPRSAAGLQCLLSRRFAVPVRIANFQGGWVFQTTSSETSARLMYDANRSCRIVVGPLSRACFKAFLPGGRQLVELLKLARLYAGPVERFEVQLILRSEEVRPVILDQQETHLDWACVCARANEMLLHEASVFLDAETCKREENFSNSISGGQL